MFYGYMVSDPSDSEKGNPLPPLHWLLFAISANDISYAPSHRQDRTAFDTSVVQLWMEREIAQWLHTRDRSDDRWDQQWKPVSATSLTIRFLNVKSCQRIFYLHHFTEVLFQLYNLNCYALTCVITQDP